MSGGRKRTPSVYVGGLGWVQKKTTMEVDYEEYAQSESWAFLISFWRWYPDQLLDLLRSPTAKYKNEELIQRVMLRAFARYQFVDITGCRSLTKTSTKMKDKLLHNVLWSNIKSSYYGPSYKQQAELARVAYHEIEDDYPGLTRHYMVEVENKDAFSVKTQTGSTITINAIRGKNIHDVTAEEFAQEEHPAFDIEEYTTVVLYAVRLLHMINGERDKTFIPYQQHTITSASRKQNHAYENRCAHLRLMERGLSAFVMDVPWQVIILSQMRPFAWAEQRRQESTAEKWTREMESIYTGTDENSIIREEVLTESRSLTLMEEHHCCRDRDNTLKPEDVIYVIGYDVAYEANKRNAKCSCVVVKCLKQKSELRRDKYLKQVVWVDDWYPAAAMEQALKLKSVWHRFTYEGAETYIAIDAWQYGKSVLQALMMDLNDGLNPLCVFEHAKETDFELQDALPVIYPIKAGGTGVTDPDADMIRYAELQFENRNVQLLTWDRNAGIENYKKYHRIKSDDLDAQIDRPYKKTNELIAQIQNLQKVPTGQGFSERRRSHHIQRDSWSALKYAFRMIEILERKYLQKERRKSDWDALLEKYDKEIAVSPDTARKQRQHARKGGRIF